MQIFNIILRKLSSILYFGDPTDDVDTGRENELFERRTEDNGDDDDDAQKGIEGTLFFIFLVSRAVTHVQEHIIIISEFRFVFWLSNLHTLQAGFII